MSILDLIMSRTKQAALAARARREGRMHPLALEIARVRAAIARWENTIDERFPFTCGVDVCCRSCKWGRAYTDECEKQGRRRAWLAILERKAADLAAAPDDAGEETR